MQRAWFLGFIGTALLSLASLSPAAVYVEGQSVSLLEDTGFSARALGMGSAFAAVAADSSALFWNPAGLAEVDGIDFGLHHQSAFGDAIQESLAVAFPMGAWGKGGANLNDTQYGSFDARDANGTLTGTYRAQDLSFKAGWAAAAAPGLDLGAAVKAIQSSLGTSQIFCADVDLGFSYALPRLGLKAALVVDNLASAGGQNGRVASAKLGLAEILNPDAELRLLISGQADFDMLGDAWLRGGLEALVWSRLALRAGYGASLVQPEGDGMRGFSLGAGLSLGGLWLDYAFLPFGDLGSSQRVSLTYVFKNPETPAAPLAPLLPAPLPRTVLKPPAAPPARPLPRPTPVKPVDKGLLVKFEVPDDGVNPDSKLDGAKQEVLDHPEDPLAWRALGTLYFKAGKKAAAIHAFDEALRLKDDPALAQWLQKYQAYP